MDRNTKAAVLIGVSSLAITVIAVLWVLAMSYNPFAYTYKDEGQKAVTIGTAANGQKTATIRLSIQPTTNTGPDGPWLGYQLQDAATNPADQRGAAIFHVPAHALVTVTVKNYDSRTALRNPYFTEVQGTVGGVEYVNGKPISVMNPNLTSHTFTIPALGVSVPMEGVPGSSGFELMRFQFRTGNSGTVRWQCIVPCGWGLYGFGGPMSQFGYMNGLIHIG